MLWCSAEPTKPCSSRATTLITSTSSTGGKSCPALAFGSGCRGLPGLPAAGPREATGSTSIGGSSRSRPPCCGSRQSASACESVTSSSEEPKDGSSRSGLPPITLGGPSNSSLPAASSGKSLRLRSNLKRMRERPPIRRQPSNRMPAMTRRPKMKSHSRKPKSMNTRSCSYNSVWGQGPPDIWPDASMPALNFTLPPVLLPLLRLL